MGFRLSNKAAGGRNDVIFLNSSGRPERSGAAIVEPVVGGSSASSSSSPESLPIWEWCTVRGEKLDGLSASKIPASQWQAYSRDQCEKIEAANRNGKPHADIEINGPDGTRGYQILFDGKKWSKLGGMVQIQPELNKVREVRRRLVSTADYMSLVASAARPHLPSLSGGTGSETLGNDLSAVLQAADHDVEERIRGMVPLWEWCTLDALQLRNMSWCEIRDNDWGVYSVENANTIETAYQKAKSMAEVTVGIKRYQIIFQGGIKSKFGGMIQCDPELNKVREVRRRLVDNTSVWYANALGAVDEQCAICLAEFAKSPELPTVSLPACGHCFHRVCAQKLADQGRDCPLCRAKVAWSEIAMLSPPGMSNHPQDHLLAEAAGDPMQIRGMRLLIAADRGNMVAVREALAQGVDVNSRSRLNATPLMSASLFGHRPVVEELIAARAHVNLQTADGNTALLMAARCGHFDICRLLLQAGADANLANMRGESAAAVPQVAEMLRATRVSL
mmetsp:Transcript_18960/g.44159  ORF Transcript_18960/g.44159 Transcript_18960/m.44159 type:complete len:505 (-) Transcript_18960:201-1715(-)|eukprot:CAMPEP_0178388748 /NCGR_PEP_ID=MMETSP0689_2-20121128/9754_1 /TAXON_ID=160604 /ORGANISM="Amphidinium massartii, Strain CS-259" /LENGTH=504 /DNA_ID=CAMNT_0020009163 /DNA_START=1 /DNA_END=1515 /DNA_ORIENTATION=+